MQKGKHYPFMFGCLLLKIQEHVVLDDNKYMAESAREQQQIENEPCRKEELTTTKREEEEADNKNKWL